MLNNYFYLAEKIIPRSMCEHIVKTAPWPNAMEAKIARGEEAQVNATFRKTEIAFLNPMSIISIPSGNNCKWIKCFTS